VGALLRGVLNRGEEFMRGAELIRGDALTRGALRAADDMPLELRE
jgi:hypothetical protein